MKKRGKQIYDSDIKAFNRLNSFQKLGLSLLAGAAGYFILPVQGIKALPHLIFSWDIFCIFLLVLTWITFYSTAPREIRKEARLQDPRSIIIFFVVLVASSVSLLGVILLITGKSDGQGDKVFQLVVTVVCMALSWALLHTIFTTRYAHLYYADHTTNAEKNAGGLDFPEEEKPDFVDFAYFAFTIGMTFQVSDVEISGKKIRRLALLHSLLSFGYNATIIALTVNIIGSLSN